MKNMNKLQISFILLIALSSLVIAAPIEVLNFSSNINLTKGIEQTITIDLFNPNAYTLHNIKVEGDILTSSSTITSLDGNENISLNLIIKTNRTGVFNENIVIYGFEEKQCDLNSIIHTINIGDRLDYSELNVCQNDSVKFINNRVNDIKFTSDELGTSGTYQTIIPNGEYIQPFINIGEFPYQIRQNNYPIFIGNIKVGTNLGQIYHEDDISTTILHITSIMEQTEITSSFSKINFSMLYNDDDIYFEVTINNIGDKKAEGINVIGDWFFSTLTNIEIPAGLSKTIQVYINPNILEISETSDTNKNYNKTLYINGPNIVTIEQPMNIFIEYSNIIGGGMTMPEWWIKRKVYCDSYPTAPDCLTEPYIIYQDRLIYDAPPILVNMSAADIKSYMNSVIGLENKWVTYDNQWKLDTDVIKNGVSDVNRVTNKTYENSAENQETFQEFKNVFYIIMGLIIFLGFISVCVFIFYKYYLMRISQREGNV